MSLDRNILRHLHLPKSKSTTIKDCDSRKCKNKKQNICNFGRVNENANEVEMFRENVRNDISKRSEEDIKSLAVDIRDETNSLNTFYRCNHVDYVPMEHFPNMLLKVEDNNSKDNCYSSVSQGPYSVKNSKLEPIKLNLNKNYSDLSKKFKISNEESQVGDINQSLKIYHSIFSGILSTGELVKVVKNDIKNMCQRNDSKLHNNNETSTKRTYVRKLKQKCRTTLRKNRLKTRRSTRDRRRPLLFRHLNNNTLIGYLLISLHFFTNTGVHTFNREACNQSLGMEDGRIPDEYITASSSYEYKSVGPQNGRLNKEYNGGAWCPKAQISGDNGREFLEIKLPGGNHIITGAATQGRFGNGQGAEYVESYFIEYKRDDMDHWRTYEDAIGDKEVIGNKNTYLVAPVCLHLPFFASRIRFIPYSQHLRTVCMRVELYGCPAKQGVIQYWGDQGHIYEANNVRIDFRDLSYDGIITNGTMSRGLGQLTDTYFGNDNVEVKPSENREGTRWVGWNHTILNRPVTLYFGFDDRKEFIDVNIQANNQKWREIECYKKVEIYVSDDPNVFEERIRADTAVFDANDVTTKNMSTPMMHAVGQFVKIVLHFAREWILVSEIQFNWVVPDTKLPLGNVKPSQPKQKNEAKQNKEIKDGSPLKESTFNIEKEYGTMYNYETTESFDNIFNISTPIFPTSSQNIPKTDSFIDNIVFKIAICIVVIIIIFILFAFLYIFCENKSKIRYLNKPKDLKNSRQSQLPTQAKMTDMVRAPTPPELDDLYSEPFRLTTTRRNSNNRTIESYSTTSLYNCDFSSFHGSRGRVSHHKPGMPYTISYSNPTNQITSNNLYAHMPDENYYAASNIVQPDCLEELCIAGYLSTMKFPPSQPPPGSKPAKVIRNDHINKISNMGFHKMGPVYLCTKKDDAKGGLVLAKHIWLGSSRRKRREFINEATWLCALRDTNVINAIGMNEENPASVFFPYSKLGDLPDYLRQRSKTMSGEIPDYGEIVIYLRQIASGMKYLESMNIVHRDLATRNCTIWDNMVVKISNHANYCSKYKQDYFVHEAKQRLPIRWLSWEALLLGKWTFQSDVWAFAVTLWEISMMCNRQPFDELTNHDIFENAVRWKNSSASRRIPSPPMSLPKELKIIFNSCLQKVPHDRPTFVEIFHMLMSINTNDLNMTYCF